MHHWYKKVINKISPIWKPGHSMWGLCDRHFLLAYIPISIKTSIMQEESYTFSCLFLVDSLTLAFVSTFYNITSWQIPYLYHYFLDMTIRLVSLKTKEKNWKKRMVEECPFDPFWYTFFWQSPFWYTIKP